MVKSLYVSVHWMVLESPGIHQESDRNSYRYTTFHVVLQSFRIHNQLLSTKKQISSLYNLYSVYEELPEELLDETDVESYFYLNNLDISQSYHRIVEISKVSNKKSLHSKCSILQSKLQQRVILKEEASISKKKLSIYSTVWVNFSKLLIKPTKYRRFHHSNLILRLDLQNQKTNCSVIVIRM